MAVLIDATVLIDYERGRIDLARALSGREEEEFFLSVVTASELLHGVHRAAQGEIRTRRSAFVEAVLDRFPVLPIDMATARVHAQVWADLSASGSAIGVHDLWLAATCLARRLTLVTSNVREFERVPGLSVESWVRAKR